MGILIKAIEIILFVGVALVLTQNLQIYPGAVLSIFKSRKRNPRSMPTGVESHFISTADNKRIEVWHLPVQEQEQRSPYVGLVFHGNAGTLENFFLMQLWFQELGIPSYSFDYRGFGKSSGWPSEKGINLDSDAFWKFVSDREQLSPDQVVVCGFSLGCVFATRMASICKPRLLVLVSPFVSASRVMADSLILRWLRPFLWDRLPTVEYFSQLGPTKVVVMHGSNDNIIPPHHSTELIAQYRGSESVQFVNQPFGHNDVFFGGWKALTDAVRSSLSGKTGA